MKQVDLDADFYLATIESLTLSNTMLKSGSDQLANERDALSKELSDLKAAVRWFYSYVGTPEPPLDEVVAYEHLEESRKHARTLLEVLEK